MNGTRKQDKFGPGDRIAAFARATEAYAESLEDPDLANVYWGKSLGLWQALTILATEEPATRGGRLGGALPADAGGPTAPTRPAVPRATAAAPAR